jgi:RNA polymerase sigma factor (TIGR02999 family)
MSDLLFVFRFSCAGTDMQFRVRQFIDSVCARWLLSPASLPNSVTLPGESLKNMMPEFAPHEVTQLLLDWRNGDPQALERLTPLVYDELRRLATQYLRRERDGHTLQATALVNEAYLQLIGQQARDWQNRAHFLAIASHLMRNILVDHARAHAAAKRGGEKPLPLDEAVQVPGKSAPDVLALDDALKDLAKHDERKCRIIELRYFGGLSMEEIAEVTGLSVAALRRDLRMAEAWLGRQIQKQ